MHVETLPAHWDAVLAEVGKHHTTTIRRVSEATGMPRAAARNIVLALVRRGLVEKAVRSYDPASGQKRFAICLTDAGRRRVRALRGRRRPLPTAA